MGQTGKKMGDQQDSTSVRQDDGQNYQATTLYTLGDDRNALPIQLPTEPQYAHIPRDSIASLRMHSVLTVGAQRASVEPTSLSNDERHGSIETKQTSPGPHHDTEKVHYQEETAQEGSVFTLIGRNTSTESVKSGSSGVTVVDEQTPRAPLQCLLQEQPAGTYILSVPKIQDATAVGEKATVEVALSPLQYSDRIAKADYLEYLTSTYPIPEIRGRMWLHKIRYDFFTVYRRLFALVFTANLIAIIIVASRGRRTGVGHAAIGVGSNIFACVLARHDHLINIVVSTIRFVPHSWPLAIRKRLGKIYCHAGIHSGCGASAAAWYIYFAVMVAIQPVTHNQGVQIAVYTSTAIQCLLLLSMVGMAHPYVRGRYHNIWELSHRYLGYTITALVWVQTILLSSTSHRALGMALVRSVNFWMVIAVTALLLYPWLVMRRRTFEAEQLSSHALRLNFDYRTVRMGDNVRLAQSPLVENHGFATIARPNGAKGYSVIISNAGDWTKNIIAAGERRGNKIWIKGRPSLGVIYSPILFSPLVIVATGSGIAPCLSFIESYPGWPVRIVWSARFPEVTYGTKIIETVLAADRDAIIIDTRETGRPNLPALMYAAYKVWMNQHSDGSGRLD